MAKPGDYGFMCEICKDQTAPPCTGGSRCPHFEKGNEYFDEQKLEQALTIHQNFLRTGGLIWTEEQLEFLRDLAQAMQDQLPRELRVSMGGSFRGCVDMVINDWAKKDRAAPIEKALGVNEEVLVLGPGLMPEPEEHHEGPSDEERRKDAEEEEREQEAEMRSDGTQGPEGGDYDGHD